MMEKTRVLNLPGNRIGWLVAVRGRRVGEVYRLGKLSTIGRDPNQCDIVIDEDSLSACHARIKLEHGRFTLYDLASTNGTFLNAQPVQRSLLADEDEVRLGRARFVFKETSAA